MSDSTATVSIKICQEGHANALALNKDNSQIAVAGRSILKIYSIDSDSFTEVCNMRSGKNQNLSYSSNDVAWSSLETNLLATAATNGVVSVWDLLKSGRHKQLLVYNEHERTAHTVTFHSTEPHLLISGSQDGTIKCFDLRMDKAVHTYFSNSESVRDVKFNPHSPNIFAAVSENGTVQLWDIKRPDKCHLQFTAHSGPIYTCDWHPNQHWLATGSRDKQIKIWNMEQKPTLEYTIHTIAVVGRVKWRPDRVHHIASCALVVDYSVYIWDVRRPYIPYASFEEHTNVTTGIGWKGNDAHVLLSTSKDSTIFKHSFKDALRPCLRANPQAVSFNFKGDLLYSYKVKNVQTSTAMAMSSAAAAAGTGATTSILGSTITSASAATTNNTMTNIISAALPTHSGGGGGGQNSIISSSPSTGGGGLSLSHFLSGNRTIKQHTTIQEQFHLAKSNLCNYIPKAEVPSLSGVFKLTLIKDLQALRGFAREYILYGKSLDEICEHNAAIALKYERPNIHLLWLIIKNVYSTNENEINNILNTNNTNNDEHQTIDARNLSFSNSQMPLLNRMLLNVNNSNINNDGGDIETTNGLLQNVFMGKTTESPTIINHQNNQSILNINTNSPKENIIQGNELNQQKIDGNELNSDINNFNQQDNLINNNTNAAAAAAADALKNVKNELKINSKSVGGVCCSGSNIPIGIPNVPTIVTGILNKLNNNNNNNNMNEHCDDYVFDETELNVSNLDIKSLRNGFLYIGPHDTITKNGSGSGHAGGNGSGNGGGGNNNNNNGNWLLPINTIIGHDLQSQDSSKQQQLLLSKNNNQMQQPPPTPPPTPVAAAAAASPQTPPTVDQPHLLKILSMDNNNNNNNTNKWKPHNIISECLTLQTETGDVQTAVCVLIAMGDKRCQLQIDELICESWLLSYIELLYRHQCWNEATEIINKSWIRSVCELNQQSTAVHTNCGECNKPLINTVGWYCQKCKSAQSSKCSVCNKVVKGLYAWCQGCSHGGHLDHLKRWFSNHSKCPRCGHLCEYE